MFMHLMTAFFPPAPVVPSPLLGAAQVMQKITRYRTALDIQRLLYIAQMIHLGRHAEPIFSEAFAASTMGPVVPKLQERIRRNRTINNPVHATALTPAAISTLEEVAASFGSMTSAQLVSITHRENGAWANHYDTRRAAHGPYSGRLISQAAMGAEYQERMARA